MDKYSVKRFTVTEQHLALIRHFEIGWSDYLDGALCISTYDTGEGIYEGIATILDDPKLVRGEDGEFSDEQIVMMEQLHEEAGIALQIAIQTGTFETGTYVRATVQERWKKEEK